MTRDHVYMVYGNADKCRQCPVLPPAQVVENGLCFELVASFATFKPIPGEVEADDCPPDFCSDDEGYLEWLKKNLLVIPVQEPEPDPELATMEQALSDLHNRYILPDILINASGGVLAVWMQEGQRKKQIIYVGSELTAAVTLAQQLNDAEVECWHVQQKLEPVHKFV